MINNFLPENLDKTNEIFHKRLTEQITASMKAQNISQYKICVDIKFSHSSWRKLMSGEHSFTTSTLMKILLYLKLKLCIDARGKKGSIINIDLIKNV